MSSKRIGIGILLVLVVISSIILISQADIKSIKEDHFTVKVIQLDEYARAGRGSIQERLLKEHLGELEYNALIGEDRDYIRRNLPSFLEKYVDVILVEDIDQEVEWNGKLHNVGGLAYWREGKITIIPELVDNKATIYHEIGHLIDFKLNGRNSQESLDYFLSEELEWIEVWRSEWETTDHYGAENLGEGFAEAFSAYFNGVLDYQEVNYKSDYPLSYLYMDNLVKLMWELDKENLRKEVGYIYEEW